STEQVLNQRYGIGRERVGLLDARCEVRIEGERNAGAGGGDDLCDGLETVNLVRNGEVLPVDAVGEGERGRDLPGVAGVNLRLVVAVTTLVAGSEREGLAGGIVVE